MLSSIRAVAPRRIPCCLHRSQSTLSNSSSALFSTSSTSSRSLSLLSRQLYQSSVPALSSILLRSNTYSCIQSQTQQFHTSPPLRQEAQQIANSSDTPEHSSTSPHQNQSQSQTQGQDHDQDQPHTTAKSSALNKLSQPSKSALASGGANGRASTLNEDGLETTFSGLRDSGLIDKRVMDTIVEDMGYETMTDVQVKTITPSLGSRDV